MGNVTGKTEEIKARAGRLASELLEAEGLELVDLIYRREPGGWVLRLLIDRAWNAPGDEDAGGVTIDDCVDVNREFGRLLEVEDLVPGPFNLEVSSPGVFRPLTRDKDFVRFAGCEVKARLVQPLNGAKKLRGRLAGLGDGTVRLETADGALEIKRENIHSITLEPELAFK